MTISTTTRKAGPFTGNSSATTFDFDFKVFAKADVQVDLTVIATGVITTLVLDTDYTLTLNSDQNNDPGGTVTYNPSGVPMPSTKTLTISSIVTATQATDITNGGAFYPNVIEDMVDRVTILAQQEAEELARSIRGPVVDEDPLSDLPVASVRASKYLFFDADGDVGVTSGGPDSVVPVSAFMETVLDDTTAANARTTLGAAASGLATASGLTMSTNKLLGRGSASTGAVEEMDALVGLIFDSTGLSAAVGADVENVALNIAIGSSAMALSLRSAYASGSPPSANSPVWTKTTTSVTAAGTTLAASGRTEVSGASSLTISSGSTLGTVSAEESRIYVALLSNGKLAVFNPYSATGHMYPIDDGKEAKITTVAEGGAGGADSAGVWYSDAVYSNVKFRVIAFIESTQATAGTWATDPSRVVIMPAGRPKVVTYRGPAVAASGVQMTLGTGLPRRIKSLKVIFNGLSSSGTSPWLLRLGFGTLIATSSYVSLVSPVAGSIASGSSTAGFLLQDAATAVDAYNGEAQISRGASAYICSSSISGTQSYVQNGKYASTADISDVVLTTAGGADTFDAGEASIEYEYYD